MLTLTNIRRNKGAKKSRKRLGRGPGSGLGKTSGKGGKGQTARSGGGIRPGFEGGQTPLYRRLPKFGFTNIFAKTWHVINVSQLDQSFTGDEVTLGHLKAQGLVKGKANTLRVLGNGELKKKLVVRAHHFSSSARSKIEAAGGTVEVLDVRS